MALLWPRCGLCSVLHAAAHRVTLYDNVGCDRTLSARRMATATVWIRHARYSKDGAANYKRPVSMAGGTSPLNAPEETMCYVFLASLTSLPRSARQCGLQIPHAPSRA
ncbi:hypothetical protein C8Q76DRAFT_747871 [Earliella scabrosa]|nr:hypothetical protein C8Q76DRAFT_747871 [Earliella scabrosa]